MSIPEPKGRDEEPRFSQEIRPGRYEACRILETRPSNIAARPNPKVWRHTWLSPVQENQTKPRPSCASCVGNTRGFVQIQCGHTFRRIDVIAKAVGHRFLSKFLETPKTWRLPSALDIWSVTLPSRIARPPGPIVAALGVECPRNRLLLRRRIGMANLRANDFPRDDDFNPPVLLPARDRVIACHRV
jgi:hypothetical protein